MVGKLRLYRFEFGNIYAQRYELVLNHGHIFAQC